MFEQWAVSKVKNLLSRPLGAAKRTKNVLNGCLGLIFAFFGIFCVLRQIYSKFLLLTTDFGFHGAGLGSIFASFWQIKAKLRHKCRIFALDTARRTKNATRRWFRLVSRHFWIVFAANGWVLSFKSSKNPPNATPKLNFPSKINLHAIWSKTKFHFAQFSRIYG